MPLADADCLALWERGMPRPRIDRALLLAAAARSGAATDWADRPLGERDLRLLELRCDWFGDRFEGLARCPACGRQLSFLLDLAALRASLPEPAGEVVEVDGSWLRLPTSRDLAAVGDAADVDAGAAALLERLVVRSGEHAAAVDAARADGALETADPAAHIAFELGCADCGHRWSAPFDIGDVLWDELQSQAQRVADDVHLLAGAYGWSEAEVLAMSAARRGLYLARVGR